ncbi:MAG: acyl carrier protein [Blastopirellula sp.]|nr:MAG: acyl carrier protein [Blastopirellula sp.]
MKQTAVIVAPGRGTYNKTELGYLGRYHADKISIVKEFDDQRLALGQETIVSLDGADRFSGPKHTNGENASPLIYSCAYADFLSIDREKFEILAVTGNSMGWYIALACGGALEPHAGMNVVNTMGTLMQNELIGGQIIYPFVNENWVEIPGTRNQIIEKVNEIDVLTDHRLAISIELGGMLVLAGNEAGLAMFEKSMPRIEKRFPMRLPNHAAFHTDLQIPVAKKGREKLDLALFQQPRLPLIDGRGFIWYPYCNSISDLYEYTLNSQVVKRYNFTGAIRTAAREFMPDVFIVLGPGNTLGGAVAQSLIQANWRGMNNKAEFQQRQAEKPLLISMGLTEQRGLVIEI